MYNEIDCDCLDDTGAGADPVAQAVRKLEGARQVHQYRLDGASSENQRSQLRAIISAYDSALRALPQARQIARHRDAGKR